MLVKRKSWKKQSINHGQARAFVITRTRINCKEDVWNQCLLEQILDEFWLRPVKNGKRNSLRKLKEIIYWWTSKIRVENDGLAKQWNLVRILKWGLMKDLKYYGFFEYYNSEKSTFLFF